MQVLSRVMVFWFESSDLPALFKRFEDAKSHESYDALSIGRMFPDLDAVLIFTGTLSRGTVYKVGMIFTVVLAFEDI